MHGGTAGCNAGGVRRPLNTPALSGHVAVRVGLHGVEEGLLGGREDVSLNPSVGVGAAWLKIVSEVLEGDRASCEVGGQQEPW